MRVFAIAGIDTNAKNESSAAKRLKFFIIARNCVIVANLDKKDVKSDWEGQICMHFCNTIIMSS